MTVRPHSLLLAFTASIALGASGELQTLRDVRDFCRTPVEHKSLESFSAEGRVLFVFPGRQNFILGDACGDRQMFGIGPHVCPHVGETVRLWGEVVVEHSQESAAYATNLILVGRQPPPPPHHVPLNVLDEQHHDLSVIATEGCVIDRFADEVDDAYVILLLKDGPTILPVSVPIAWSGQLPNVDTQVRVTGVYFRTVQGSRKFYGPSIVADSISVLNTPKGDFFDAPRLESVIYRSPREVASLGKRRVDGEVLASWEDSRLMVRERNGRIVNVLLARPFGENPPPCGTFVTAAGYPETDLFRINLAKSRFRLSSDTVSTNETPICIFAADILTDHGLRLGCDTYHGKLVRLDGIVRSLPADGAVERRLILDSGNFRIPVDFSTCPKASEGLALGSKIEVTGRCLLMTDAWRPNNVFPRLTGFTVVLRTANDIRILSRPSWWTPARLLILIGFILAALAAILVWNVSLRRLAERRGHELFAAQIAQASSELRVDERTRLAVELHDSISQSLTGASLRIDAARRCVDTSRDKTIRNLDVASRTLDSCREELRNCIWDLRNQSLETNDMNAAIRTALLRHVEDTALSVRFNVPRERLTDNTAHALMHIIRELTVNALRHGHAKSIKIAGAIENGRLLFSVTDDGYGFDPDDRPGVSEGHFGLDGVAERIRRLDGEMKIESRPGHGTRVALSLKLPDVPKGEESYGQDHRSHCR